MSHTYPHTVITTTIILVGCYLCLLYLTQPPDLPQLTLGYWGPGKDKTDDEAIKPFKVNFSQADINELKEKLNNTRTFVPPLEGIGFEYGFNTDYLNKFVEFWKTKYDWKERENYLNNLPQFITQIGGLNVHFIHVKPDPAKAKDKKIIPLLLIHGWPGSVKEFYKMIPMLTTPRADSNFAFEVVAPSLPGYGFSEAASKGGLNTAQIGLILDRLMARLSFDSYFLHGGDWGAIIGLTQAILLPNRILGYHSNLCVPRTVKSMYYMLLSYLFPDFFVEQSKKKFYTEELLPFLLEESGYYHIQASKPDTIGTALTDSPVGLAAYILEKFSTGTNRHWRSLPDGGIESMDKVDLLDNIMIYWLTKTITTSGRLYAESTSSKYLNLRIEQNPVTVPSSCVWFENEIMYFPRIALEGSFSNLVAVNHYSVGGHFAALEEPELLSEDIWNFVKILRIKNVRP